MSIGFHVVSKPGLTQISPTIIFPKIMIGTSLKTENGEYRITKLIAGPDRPNANVYLCLNQNDEEFIAKHFYKGHPMENIGLNKYNHYGRRRDGSETVFNEIREKNAQFPFLTKHIDRINHQGKWIVIQEFVKGVTLSDYIYDHYKDQLDKVLKAVEIFALTLKEWHDNEFAHGDPHLENVVVNEDEFTDAIAIKLIDYCQIHHPSFYYCEYYDCFDSQSDRRIKEDLHQPSGKLGKGFRHELIEIDRELSIDNKLVEVFDKFYVTPNCL